MIVDSNFVHECFDFHADGYLVWKTRPAHHFPNDSQRTVAVMNARFANHIAGFKRKDGYTLIKLLGRHYMSHRLVWIMFYGEWPDGILDHINGNKSDNRLENLRVVSNLENSQNQRVAQRSNKSAGMLGVSLIARTKRYIARITANGECIYLGSFKTIPEAHQAYLDAKRELHSTCTI